MTSKYEITCIDKEGDKLKIISIDGTAEIQNANKFTIPVSGDKIKRLVEGISSVSFILEDFGLVEISVKIIP